MMNYLPVFLPGEFTFPVFVFKNPEKLAETAEQRSESEKKEDARYFFSNASIFYKFYCSA